MNKTELVQVVAERAGVQRSVADKTVTALFDILADELALGNSVVLTGFGTFAVKERSARKGRNPKTGDSIEIAAAKVPYFKPGKTLKNMVKVYDSVLLSSWSSKNY